MVDSFSYAMLGKVYFGYGKLAELESLLKECKVKRAVLVTSKSFKQKCLELWENIEQISAVFSDVEPNPQLANVEGIVKLMKEYDADTVIALGGGSSIDAAKFAACCAYSDKQPAEHYEGAAFPEKIAKIIAIPTTSGTGSEVTAVSVISRGGEKKSIHNPAFAPTACIVDPELTMTVPAKLTMITGIDAFTHAIEAYWSVNHSPLTDLFAIESLKLITSSLEKAFTDGDEESRTAMAYGSLLAGLAFSAAKTAASHACSFPLSMYHHLPHGEACAFTLDSLIRINADERLEKLAKEIGFENTDALAAEIAKLKKLAGFKTKLSECEGEIDVDRLARESANHMLMRNNPVKLGYEELKELFESLV